MDCFVAISEAEPSAAVSDVLAAVCVFSGVRPVDAVDFFESLPPYRDTDLSKVNRARYAKSLVQRCAEHSYRMAIQREMGANAARGGLWGSASIQGHIATSVEIHDRVRKDNYVHYLTKTGGGAVRVVDQSRHKGRFKESAIHPHNYVSGPHDKLTRMTRSQCRTLLHTGVLAMEEPAHALFVQRNADTAAVAINDPEYSSLQYIERLVEGVLEGMNINNPYPPAYRPGGWCQTWSLFQLECAIMGCSWLHDSLVGYFTAVDNKDFHIHVKFSHTADPDAPDIIKRFVAAFNPQGPGYGYALSEFVRRLAERYVKLFNDKKAGNTRNLYRQARARVVQPPPTPPPPTPVRDDPRAAAIERIMKVYVADKLRYTRSFCDLGLGQHAV